MKQKLSVLFFIIFLFSFQNADAQLFKRLKKKAKEKAKQIENKVIDKIDKETDKTIDDAIEGGKDTESSTKDAKKTADFGDVTLNHSQKYGSVQITEVSKVKVSKNDSGYTIRGNWWSHEADIYDGFMVTINTTENLKQDSEDAKNTAKRVFKIPKEASLKLGYDPQLPYNKKPEGNFKRAVTDDYQNYDILEGEVTISVLTDESIQIEFSGKGSLREVIRKAGNPDDYTETFFEASISGGIDAKTPQFINEQTIIKKDKNTQPSTTQTTNVENTQTTSATPGLYNFTSETVTKITVSEENKTYTMSYLLNPNAEYIGISVEMNQYSDGDMNGESIIVMDNGNSHIFVETSGMKMRMSSAMMGQQKMQNPTDQMANYDYTNLSKTGNTKTILGETCEEYVMSDNNTKINLWVAPNLKLPNWFAQNNEVFKGYIMEYSIESKEGTMKSEVIEIKKNTHKTINPKEYKKMF